MEQLEKLKNVWQNQAESSIKFSDVDIYDMLHKKSSSVVKWILIISILEFALPNLIYLVTDHDASRKIYENYGLTNITMIYTAIHVLIISAFIYIFYKNYKNISADSSVKELLHDILKTRKTVKYYIYYNLTIMGVIGLHIFYAVFNSEEFQASLATGTSMVKIWIFSIIFLCLALLIFWLFYRILYGFFLKKLKRNYAALSQKDGL